MFSSVLKVNVNHLFIFRGASEPPEKGKPLK